MRNITDLRESRQLHIPFMNSETDLKDLIRKETGKDIFLAITDNSHSMLSFRIRGSSVLLRLHRIFLSAGMPVILEIAGLVRGKRQKTPLIRRFIEENGSFIKKRPARKIRLRAEGRHHDLLDIAHRINRDYFDSRISSGITWGTQTARRAARRRTLGSYTARTDLIRLNPVLDRKDIPSFFLEFIVYHEMLHADMGTEEINGRRSVHSREFRRRERLFRDYEKALAWEKNAGI